jgi:hypothetical protein
MKARSLQRVTQPDSRWLAMLLPSQGGAFRFRPGAVPAVAASVMFAVSAGVSREHASVLSDPGGPESRRAEDVERGQGNQRDYRSREGVPPAVQAPSSVRAVGVQVTRPCLVCPGVVQLCRRCRGPASAELPAPGRAHPPSEQTRGPGLFLPSSPARRPGGRARMDRG